MTDEEKIVENKAETENDTTCVYEIGYLLLPTLPEEKLESEVAALKGIVEKHGGSLISDDFPRRRVLAYTMTKEIETKINKFHEAYFGWFKFEATKDSAVKIKKECDLYGNILRFILINTVKEDTLYHPKLLEKKSEDGDDIPEEEKTPASAEEIDKSIDALVI